MTRRTGLREARQAEVRRRIFHAAMQLFSARGFEATTVEEITAAAGVSRATYFNHFGTKEGVLRYFGEELAARLNEAAARIASSGQPPVEQLRALLQVWADHVTAHREEVRVLFQHRLRDPSYAMGLTPARQQALELFTGLVDRAQAAGEARRDMPPRHLALHLLSVYQTAVLFPALTGEPPEPLLDSAWQFIAGGMRGVDSSAE